MENAKKARNFKRQFLRYTMIKADKIHKQRVIDILSDCFEANKTVNYIVKQDEKKKERIRFLMDYSFDMCLEAGQILMTDDMNGVIICSNSTSKLPILEEAFQTAKFVWKVSGIDGIGRVLKRETYLNSYHPQDEEYMYIWFMGVDKGAQGKGVGSAMIDELIRESNLTDKTIYLETSSESHLQFYKKHGFDVYHIAKEDVFGYELYFLRRFPENHFEKEDNFTAQAHTSTF